MMVLMRIDLAGPRFCSPHRHLGAHVLASQNGAAKKGRAAG